MMSFQIDPFAVYVIGAAGFWLMRWQKKPHCLCALSTKQIRALARAEMRELLAAHRV